MKQLENDILCKYCLGCNKLLNEYFLGTRNCKGFVPGYKDWRRMYDEAIKNKLKEKR